MANGGVFQIDPRFFGLAGAAGGIGQAAQGIGQGLLRDQQLERQGMQDQMEQIQLMTQLLGPNDPRLQGAITGLFGPGPAPVATAAEARAANVEATETRTDLAVAEEEREQKKFNQAQEYRNSYRDALRARGFTPGTLEAEVKILNLEDLGLGIETKEANLRLINARIKKINADAARLGTQIPEVNQGFYEQLGRWTGILPTDIYQALNAPGTMDEGRAQHIRQVIATKQAEFLEQSKAAIRSARLESNPAIEMLEHLVEMQEMGLVQMDEAKWSQVLADAMNAIVPGSAEFVNVQRTLWFDSQELDITPISQLSPSEMAGALVEENVDSQVSGIEEATAFVEELRAVHGDNTKEVITNVFKAGSISEDDYDLMITALGTTEAEEQPVNTEDVPKKPEMQFTGRQLEALSNLQGNATAGLLGTSLTTKIENAAGGYLELEDPRQLENLRNLITSILQRGQRLQGLDTSAMTPDQIQGIKDLKNLVKQIKAIVNVNA